VGILILIFIILGGLFGFSSEFASSSTVAVATVEAPSDTAYADDCAVDGMGVRVSAVGDWKITVVPEALAAPWITYLGEDATAYTLPQGDVQVAAAVLYGEQPGLAGYDMNFVAYTDAEGVKRVFVDAAMDQSGDPVPDEGTCVAVEPLGINVADGGEDYFDATINLETHEVEHFAFHGQA
jgi:hypothetical protein